MQSRGDASSEAFAPFCSTCSVASRRNVTSSTRAISTVSELRMAPRTASPLNFCARSFQRMENGSVRSGQLARFEIFTDHERPLAFSLSLFDLLSPPSRVSLSLSLSLSLPLPLAPRHAANWPRNLLPRQRINSRV